MAGVLALVVVLAGAAVWLLREPAAPGSIAGAGLTIALGEDGGIALASGAADAPVVELWVDYACPHCRMFHQESGEGLAQMAADGDAQVVVRPVSVFAGAGEPDAGNSLRAGSAALCAAEYGSAAAWTAYNDRLFTEQPMQGDPGFEADRLVAWGQEAGIDDPAFAGCVSEGRYTDELAVYTQEAITRWGSFGTPTVAVEGEQVSGSGGALPTLEQIREAAGGTPV
ncbi:protein-disulfide isomerase [Allonocardiopsis opalescens]|uniref:Protein-disulfide isomerase n=1 Tax=Allonocardiopsis opalescens TaxID=1144618 RepID=A0A2T0Q475_9ACTN|nr:protein-disulfide isomerase [Allonocardiopsis opalescens]